MTNDTKHIEQQDSPSDLNDGLAVMFGTRWVVTREVSEYYSCEQVVAVCRTQELAFSVMRNRPDYGRYKIEYDCHEVDNYE